MYTWAKIINQWQKDITLEIKHSIKFHQKLLNADTIISIRRSSWHFICHRDTTEEGLFYIWLFLHYFSKQLYCSLQKTGSL